MLGLYLKSQNYFSLQKTRQFSSLYFLINRKFSTNYKQDVIGGKTSSYGFSHTKWKTFCREANAVYRLLERSGVSPRNQFAILTSCLHTTSRQSSSHGPGGSSGGSSSSSGSDPNDDKKNDDNDRNNMLMKVTIRLLFYVVMGWMVFSTLFGNPMEREGEVSLNVSWSEFVQLLLSKGEVQKIVVRPDTNVATIFLHEGAIIKGKKSTARKYDMNIGDIEQFESKLRETETSLGIRADHSVPVIYDRIYNSDNDRKIVALLILLPIILRFFYNSSIKVFSNPFKMMPRRFTMIDPLLPGSGRGVKFSDVAGAQEAKQEVIEFVDFLKNPAKYQRLGAKVPKGALLLGPPGCGKTLLAKAVATEGQVPFLAMNGSEFVEMIGGLGASRVRDLFKAAKKRSPCIVYIDEVDAIGRQRAASTFDGTSQESEQTLNQLLVEMDGILSKEGVVVMASTNRLDILDKALLRPGRFDRHIIMDLPTLEERREIFDHHLKSVILEKPRSFYSRRMASLSLGFTGADIANAVNEAALHAARNAQKVVTAADLEYAIERMVGGIEKRSQVLSPQEKRVVAFHESGHALVGWLLKHTDALLKVTIVPRTNQALGFAQYIPKEQRLYTQNEIFEKMCMALGGRVAESLVFNRITTGAQNDLDKVTKMAYAQVRTFGFSEAVGQVSFPEEETRELGRRPYSQRLAATIDEEVSKLTFKAYKATEEVLKNNMDKLRLLAEALLQKETLNYDEVEAILGPPPHGPKVLIEPLQFENEMKTWKDTPSQ